MPLRMSVRPTASHTRTPLGTGIIVAPAPRPQPPPKPATPKPGSAYGRCPRIRSRSPAQAVRQRHHQLAPPAPERSHSPRPEDPAASGRSNSPSRRPDAPRLALPHRTRMPPLQSPPLLDAPPATPLGTSQYLDACHRTVSCTGANTGVCTTAQSRHTKPTDGMRPSPEGYPGEVHE